MNTQLTFSKARASLAKSPLVSPFSSFSRSFLYTEKENKENIKIREMGGGIKGLNVHNHQSKSSGKTRKVLLFTLFVHSTDFLKLLSRPCTQDLH